MPDSPTNLTVPNDIGDWQPDDAYERGFKDAERRIVEWLREWTADPSTSQVDAALRDAADAIERGEHRG